MMKKDILKKIIREEFEKMSEESPTMTQGAEDILSTVDEDSEPTVFSTPEQIKREVLRFDSLYKSNLQPVLVKAQEISSLINTNAKSLPPQVVSDFRSILIKLKEIKDIKQHLLDTLK